MWSASCRSLYPESSPSTVVIYPDEEGACMEMSIPDERLPISSDLQLVKPAYSVIVIKEVNKEPLPTCEILK